MITIGTRANLRIVREQPFGVFLDAENLGEILLPRGEMPREWVIGEELDVFIYLDSEDRLVATMKTPRAMPGQFAKLKCVAVTGVGAFLEWGLGKDLLVPFREQKTRMEPGKSYLVRVLVDCCMRMRFFKSSHSEKNSKVGYRLLEAMIKSISASRHRDGQEWMI